jgi:hypothetical protein
VKHWIATASTHDVTANENRSRSKDSQGCDFCTLASLVMPAHSRSKDGVASLAYVAGIHVFAACVKPKTWMAGTSPAMTMGDAGQHVHSSRSEVLSRIRTAPGIVIDQGKT